MRPITPEFTRNLGMDARVICNVRGAGFHADGWVHPKVARAGPETVHGAGGKGQPSRCKCRNLKGTPINIYPGV